MAFQTKQKMGKRYDKKGDITIETIVLVALALIFLIIVAFVITGKISLFSKGIGGCENKGGLCFEDEEDCYGTVGGFDCTDKTQICCLNTCEGIDGTCKESSGECGSSQERIYTVACPKEDQICCK